MIKRKNVECEKYYEACKMGIITKDEALGAIAKIILNLENTDNPFNGGAKIRYYANKINAIKIR